MELFENNEQYFLSALRYCAKDENLGQKEIAFSAGYGSTSYINQIINGKKSIPGVRIQKKIAAACRYSYGKFLLLGESLSKKDTEKPSPDITLNRQTDSSRPDTSSPENAKELRKFVEVIESQKVQISELKHQVVDLREFKDRLLKENDGLKRENAELKKLLEGIPGVKKTG